jgi:hypothetical protein
MTSDITGLEYSQQSPTWSRAITQTCEPIPIGGKQPTWLSNLSSSTPSPTAYYSAMPPFRGVTLVDLVKVPIILGLQP